ncbi:MAG: PqqD family protein [Lachnospiraceae bacterium]|nr:PqqD family protein [Lachnospiraceae bacterium]
MKAIQDLILREVAEEHILIPVGKAALKLHGMITLSESGLLLWNMLQKDCTEEELVNAITAEYMIDKETAIADVKSFIVQMKQVGLLED